MSRKTSSKVPSGLIKYRLIRSVSHGNVVNILEVDGEFKDLGWLCSLINDKSDRLATELPQALEAVLSGECDSRSVGANEIEVVLYRDRAEFLVPFQDMDDYNKITTIVFPLSVFREALTVWLDFCNRMG